MEKVYDIKVKQESKEERAVRDLVVEDVGAVIVGLVKKSNITNCYGTKDNLMEQLLA